MLGYNVVVVMLPIASVVAAHNGVMTDKIFQLLSDAEEKAFDMVDPDLLPGHAGRVRRQNTDVDPDAYSAFKND